MRVLVQLDGAAVRTSAPPVLRAGFRPFFLAAAGWVAVALPLWAMVLGGHVVSPQVSSVWHGHEMLSGFTFAVVAGFLLTAVRNWTGRETARGTGLGVLVALWAAARIAALSGATGLVEGIFDGLLIFGVFVAVLRPITASRNFRNAPFLVVLTLWGGLDALVHASPERASWALARELDLVTFLMVVITGRVLPGFTQNALPDACVRRAPATERAAIVATIAAVVTAFLPVPAMVPGVLGLVAGLLVLLRARGWGTASTIRTPILWVLHLGHAWLGVGLVLRGLATLLPAIPPTLGTHALTAGAVGTLTLGMMTRVALGHTGRPLETPPLSVAGYALVTVATLVRLTAAVLPSVALWTLAAVAFSLAFVSFLIDYAPILWRPRADGLRE